jgi:septal ring factor EnvC (AmiA/AmiB activator)
MLILATIVSYVLIHGSTNKILSGPNINLTSVLAKRSEYGHDFLWFRTAKGAYVIRDAATLERVDRLFDAEQALDPDSERLRAKMRPLEKRESQLDREIDAIEDDDDHNDRDDARLSKLHSEMREVEEQLRVLEREEEALDHRRDALEAEAERRMAPVLEDAIRSGIARPAPR